MKRAADVSCLALTLFYDYLELHGHDRAELQQGLPYTPEYLDDRTNWIDYPTFLEIERRVRTLFPDDPDLYFKVGCRLATSNRALAFTRVLVRSVLSPQRVYKMIPRIVPRFLFGRVSITFERTGRKALRGRYVFDDGYVPSDGWIETARGILASLPTNMGLPLAQVTPRRVGPHEVQYDVSLDAQWLGIGDFLQQLWRRIASTSRMRLENLRATTVELEDTNRLLAEKVEALTEAKGLLDEKVRDLSIVNALARVSARELDVERLIHQVATEVSAQLGDAPTAVLLSEGDPAGLVVGAQAAVTMTDLYSVLPLSDPECASTVCLLDDRQAQTIDDWLVWPLSGRQRVVGALAIHSEYAPSASLLESLTSQLALALDNALSYQLVAELRDGLEVRVLERTVELEEARSALEQTVHQLERSDQARRDFFTNVSHEFRTPLTLILAPLDELTRTLRAPGLEGAQQSVDHIRRNANALLRLINELLDFAKLDAAEMPLDLHGVDLTELIHEVTETLRPLADEKGVNMDCKVIGDDASLVADPKLMRRVVINLVVNAIKYIAPGDDIVVEVERREDQITLTVADTGPGIPAADCATIFDRFKRVNESSDFKVQGTGIGLAMVKEIVELHRGCVRLDSDVGQGARFIIDLPVETDQVSGTADLPRTADPAARDDGQPVEVFDLVPPESTGDIVIPVTEETVDAERSRVLLVEDNPDMRRFLQQLVGAEHHVVAVENGEVALERARELLPAVIVSDVMMPRMDGFELCRRLKADPATTNIPVVLVSAMPGSEAAISGLAAGAADFVTKPFSAPELLARINTQIRIRRLALTVMRMEKQASMGVMASGIAHEVLNPVHAVLNGLFPLRMMLEQLEEADQESSTVLLDIIEESSHRITKIVKAMLRLARQTGEEPAREKSNLSEGIDAVLTLFEHRTRGRITVHRDLSWDQPLSCYPDLLFQVISNLVSNAVDAVGDKEGHIYIRTEGGGDEVRVTVGDSGPGVYADVAEKIFTPFFTTKDPGAGTGLGLAISREIVDMHGGALELHDPSPASAERFMVTLPIVD